MKDFDAERNLRPRRTVEERTFVLGGQTFVARDRFRPEVLNDLESLHEAKVDHTTCVCQHRLHEHPSGPCTAVGCTCEKMNPAVLEPGSTLADNLAAIDSTICAMLTDEGSRDRYLALRADEDDPLEVKDLMQVVKWMTSGDTARPTGGPVVSTPGPASTGTPSTAASSEPVPAAA